MRLHAPFFAVKAFHIHSDVKFFSKERFTLYVGRYML